MSFFSSCIRYKLIHWLLMWMILKIYGLNLETPDTHISNAPLTSVILSDTGMLHEWSYNTIFIFKSDTSKVSYVFESLGPCIPVIRYFHPFWGFIYWMSFSLILLTVRIFRFSPSKHCFLLKKVCLDRECQFDPW